MNTEETNQEITLDTSGLEAPEPLERVLEALSVLKPHQRLRMLVDREPRPLYSILTQNSFLYETTTTADYRYEVLIWHKN